MNKGRIRITNNIQKDEIDIITYKNSKNLNLEITGMIPYPGYSSDRSLLYKILVFKKNSFPKTSLNCDTRKFAGDKCINSAKKLNITNQNVFFDWTHKNTFKKAFLKKYPNVKICDRIEDSDIAIDEEYAQSINRNLSCFDGGLNVLKAHTCKEFLISGLKQCFQFPVLKSIANKEQLMVTKTFKTTSEKLEKAFENLSDTDEFDFFTLFEVVDSARAIFTDYKYTYVNVLPSWTISNIQRNHIYELECVKEDLLKLLPKVKLYNSSTFDLFVNEGTEELDGKSMEVLINLAKSKDLKLNNQLFKKLALTYNMDNVDNLNKMSILFYILDNFLNKNLLNTNNYGDFGILIKKLNSNIEENKFDVVNGYYRPVSTNLNDFTSILRKTINLGYLDLAKLLVFNFSSLTVEDLKLLTNNNSNDETN